MKLLFAAFVGLSLAVLISATGCTSKSKEAEPAKRDIGKPQVAGAGGAANVEGEDEGGAAVQNNKGGQAANANAGNAVAQNNNQGNTRVVNGVLRTLPSVAGAGGAAAGRPAPTNNNRPASNSTSGSNNGLFPPSGGGSGGSGALAVTGFGALFPPGADSMVSTADSGSPKTTSPSNPGRPSVAGAGGARGNAAANDSAKAEVATKATATLKDQAAKLFEEGNESDGTRALYAHMLLDANAFDQYPLQWYDQIQKPRVFLHWGIGVSYSATKEYKGDLPPLIGDEVEEQSRNAPAEDSLRSAGTSGGVTGEASKSKYGKIDTDTPAGALMYYGGDYAERLYRRLNDRRTSGGGYFGKILVDLPERKPTKPGTGAQVATAAPLKAIPASQRNRPSVAGAGGASAPTGDGAGAPGAGGAGAAAAGAAGAGAAKSIPLAQRWTGTEEASKPSSSMVSSLMPGVMYIGEAKKEELIDRAKKLGLDVLIVLDVKVNKSGRQFFSSTVLRVFDPIAGNETIVQGKALRNTDVMEKREKTSDADDPVELDLDKVFRDYVDAHLKAAEMPGWDQAKATAHVDALLADSVDKLRSAVEVMGLYRMKLIDAAKASAALDELLGGGGQVLLFGKDADREEFVKSLAKDNSSSPSAAR